VSAPPIGLKCQASAITCWKIRQARPKHQTYDDQTYDDQSSTRHLLYPRHYVPLPVCSKSISKKGESPKEEADERGGEKGGEVYERAEGDQAKDARKRTRDEQQSWSHLDKLENLSHIPR